MKSSHFLPALSLVLVCAGCSTTRVQQASNHFVFSHEGTTYEIISRVIPSDRRHNILVHRDGNRVVLSAKDIDQNGTLDTLLTGEGTLARANEIYARGIAEAKELGKCKIETPERSYELSRPEGRYAIQTFLLGPETAYNTFILFDPTGQPATIGVDTDADGTVDKLEQGDVPLERIHALYTMVLTEGQRNGRIEVLHGTYLVTRR